jgi:hypothetical protein
VGLGRGKDSPVAYVGLGRGKDSPVAYVGLGRGKDSPVACQAGTEGWWRCSSTNTRPRR